MTPNSKTCLPLVAGLLFLSTLALAQKPWTLQWGAPHKPENPGSIYTIVHTDQQGYYAMRCRIPNSPLSNKAQKAALELYDKDLNFVKAEALDLEYKGESLEFTSFVSLKGKHFLLSAYYNAKQEKKYLFARAVNLQTLKCEGEYVKIMELEVTSKFRYPYFIPVVSPDSSLMLVYGTLNFQDGKKQRFSLAVMDSAMKVLWAQDVERPKQKEYVGFYDYAIDNQGNAYLLGAQSHTNKEIKASKEFADYRVFAYLDGGTSFKEYEASLGEKHITEINFEVLKNGDLLCAGFYSDKGILRGLNSDKERIKGVFSYKLNGQNGKEYDKSTQEFSLKIRTSDLSSNKQEKAKNNKDNDDQELKEYVLRLLNVQEDGSILLVGEKYHLESIPGSKAGSTRNIPHHDDLLVVKLDAKGQIAWASKVDKNQKGDIVDEFAFIPTADKQYFIYENGFGRSDKLNLATVSSDGKVSYAPFNAIDFKVENGKLISPSSKTVIVWPDSNSKSRLGKLVFH